MKGFHLGLRRLCSILLGLVFFIAGMLKLMDPVGAGLVVEEYFEFFHLGWLAFASKWLAVILALVETLTGAALIAGFIEIGESIEDTVRREVMEEAGLKAVNIRYYKSQPWGFASNLMIGCICDIEGSDEIEIHDTQEIAKAVWVTREQLTKPNSTVTLTDEMIAYYKYGESFREHLIV